MIIEHVAIWTSRPEVLRDFYTGYFGGISGPVYHNPKKQFRSYFIEFGSGSRLEIMSAPGIPENRNDREKEQHLGIIHFAFAAATREEVDDMARKLKGDGNPVLDGPRRTGDGYYEFVTLDPDGNRIEVTTGIKDDPDLY
jgi:lactoylglutathione lyase